MHICKNTTVLQKKHRNVISVLLKYQDRAVGLHCFINVHMAMDQIGGESTENPCSNSAINFRYSIILLVKKKVMNIGIQVTVNTTINSRMNYSNSVAW